MYVLPFVIVDYLLYCLYIIKWPLGVFVSHKAIFGCILVEHFCYLAFHCYCSVLVAYALCYNVRNVLVRSSQFCYSMICFVYVLHVMRFVYYYIVISLLNWMSVKVSTELPTHLNLSERQGNLDASGLEIPWKLNEWVGGNIDLCHKWANPLKNWAV